MKSKSCLLGVADVVASANREVGIGHVRRNFPVLLPKSHKSPRPQSSHRVK